MTDNFQEIEVKIRRILEQELGVQSSVLASDPLFSGGLLESIDMINLITFLEQEFSTKISALEVNLDNFDSIEQIQSYIMNSV